MLSLLQQKSSTGPSVSKGAKNAKPAGARRKSVVDEDYKEFIGNRIGRLEQEKKLQQVDQQQKLDVLDRRLLSRCAEGDTRGLAALLKDPSSPMLTITHLYQACAHGQQSMVAYLIKYHRSSFQKDINCIVQDDMTCLMVALKVDHFNIIKLLVSNFKNLEIDVENLFSRSALTLTHDANSPIKAYLSYFQRVKSYKEAPEPQETVIAVSAVSAVTAVSAVSSKKQANTASTAELVLQDMCAYFSTASRVSYTSVEAACQEVGNTIKRLSEQEETYRKNPNSALRVLPSFVLRYESLASQLREAQHEFNDCLEQFNQFKPSSSVDPSEALLALLHQLQRRHLRANSKLAEIQEKLVNLANQLMTLEQRHSQQRLQFKPNITPQIKPAVSVSYQQYIAAFDSTMLTQPIIRTLPPRFNTANDRESLPSRLAFFKELATRTSDDSMLDSSTSQQRFETLCARKSITISGILQFNISNELDSKIVEPSNLPMIRYAALCYESMDFLEQLKDLMTRSYLPGIGISFHQAVTVRNALVHCQLLFNQELGSIEFHSIAKDLQEFNQHLLASFHTKDFRHLTSSRLFQYLMEQGTQLRYLRNGLGETITIDEDRVMNTLILSRQMLAISNVAISSPVTSAMVCSAKAMINIWGAIHAMPNNLLQKPLFDPRKARADRHHKAQDDTALCRKVFKK